MSLEEEFAESDPLLSAKESSSSIAHGHDEQKLSWLGTVAILTTFATSGAVVTVPYAFGTFGYVLAPVLLVLWGLIVLRTNLLLVDVANEEPGTCKCLADVGDRLAGKPGRILFASLQLINLVFCMPIVLFMAGTAAGWFYSVISKNSDYCAGIPTIVVWVILWILVQFVRSLKEAEGASIGSVVMVIVKALVLLPVGLLLYPNPNGDQPVNPAWTNPTTWQTLAMAWVTFAYCISPYVVVVETMNKMQNPKQITSALTLSVVLMTLIYLVPGFVAVFAWGAEIANPVNGSFPVGAVGILLNLFLMYASMIDYLIAASVVNGYIQRSFWPDFDFSDFSCKTGVLTFFLISLAPNLFAAIAATSIPYFDVIDGLISPWLIVLPNMFCIPLLWLYRHHRHRPDTSQEVMCSPPSPLKLAQVWCICTLGIPLTLFVFFGTISYIINQPSSALEFFC